MLQIPNFGIQNLFQMNHRLLNLVNEMTTIMLAILFGKDLGTRKIWDVKHFSTNKLLNKVTMEHWMCPKAVKAIRNASFQI